MSHFFSGSLSPDRVFASITAASCASVCCAGTFTDAVIDYAPGAISSSALQQNGNAATGLPAAIDDGNTTPFSPPFHASAITIIGGGGHITLHFASPVTPVDGPDIGVFTNTGLVATTLNGALTSTTTPAGLPGVFSTDSATISVSADNITWIPLNNNNPVDLTMPSNAFLNSVASGTHFSGGTLPSDPYIPFTASLSQFAGLTYPQMLTLFNGSFGGAWIDASPAGLPQINYIRFDVPTGKRLVLDAVTAVPEPASLGILAAGALLFLKRRPNRQRQRTVSTTPTRRLPSMNSPTLLAGALLLLAATAAHAAPFTVAGTTYDVDFITSAGTITDPASANHALLALDFDPAHVYLFGYQWQSGAKTGLNMFNDVAANSALLASPPNTITFDLPFGPTFISGIDYKGHNTTDSYDPATYSTWAYYFSDNHNPFTYPETFGASDRPLLNGSVDDWTLLSVSPIGPDFLPTRAPTPLAAVPEPASLAFLSLSSLLLLRRKR